MVFIKLSIFSDDMDYSLAFAESLSVLKSNILVNVVKDESELLADSNFDLLILDTENEASSEKFATDRRVLKMTDSYADSAKSIESMAFVLYKYSGIQELAADILLYHSLLTGKKSFSWSADSPKIIVFCSVKGGVGKTTIAFCVGQALRRYYSKSVLYLSMEEIESTPLYIEDSETRLSICEYLYYLFKAGGNRPDNEAFMIYDRFGMAAFKPDTGKNRLRELSTEEMALLLKEMSAIGSYDYILIDMGECLSEETKWVFGFCHKTVAVLSPECDTDMRERRFLKCLNYAMASESGERVVNVWNKIIDRDCGSDNDGRILVDFDEESIYKSGEVTEISIDQDLGSGIKSLVKRVL